MVGIVALFAPLVPSQAEQIVFSEIIYHPRGNQPEYIEVYNNTATPFDIAQWRLTGGAGWLDDDAGQDEGHHPDETQLPDEHGRGLYGAGPGRENGVKAERTVLLG